VGFKRAPRYLVKHAIRATPWVKLRSLTPSTTRGKLPHALRSMPGTTLLCLPSHFLRLLQNRSPPTPGRSFTFGELRITSTGLRWGDTVFFNATYPVIFNLPFCRTRFTGEHRLRFPHPSSRRTSRARAENSQTVEHVLLHCPIYVVSRPKHSGLFPPRALQEIFDPTSLAWHPAYPSKLYGRNKSLRKAEEDMRTAGIS